MLLAVTLSSNLSHSSSNAFFDVDHDIKVVLSVNGVSHDVVLYSTSQNCPEPGLGLLTVTSNNVVLFNGPDSPVGINALTYGEIVVIGDFTTHPIQVSFFYGGCVYHGTL